ncbi:meiotic nuclear division protein 1 [Pholiota molesta]|nr:meiotic nuclear division protein 1 [Pholiota molesta]
MAPRGLSAEEKRVKLLEIFHETRDFYQLKELEKLGPKLKGIVDDGLVQADKIGSSNFFWSFPSQHGVLVQTKLDKVREAGNTHRTQVIEFKNAIEAARAERIDSDVRINKLKNLSELKKICPAYGDSNPAKVEEVKRAAFLAKEAAYRWTDNYGVLLGHFTRQNGISPEDIRQYLSISEDYEDLE